MLLPRPLKAKRRFCKRKYPLMIVSCSESSDGTSQISKCGFMIGFFGKSSTTCGINASAKTEDNKEAQPVAAKSSEKNFYMVDFANFLESEQGSILAYRELRVLIELGGFNLLICLFT